MQRLEVQLRGAKRDMDAAMDALRGSAKGETWNGHAPKMPRK